MWFYKTSTATHIPLEDGGFIIVPQNGTILVMNGGELWVPIQGGKLKKSTMNFAHISSNLKNDN